MSVEIITKSRLAAFNSCQRLHHLTYNLGYRALQDRELADWGTLFHAGLDAWWGTYRDDAAPLLHVGALANALLAMEAARSSLAVDDTQMVKAQIMMAAYDTRWAPTMPEWEVLGVEVEFIAVVPGRKRLRVAGKLDKLLRKRADRTIWFAEHKTTGADLSAGSTYWQRLRMDPQVSIYHSGCRALGYEPAGCLYDVIDRPALRPLKATPVELRKYTKATAKEPSRLYANQRDTDETIDEFSERLAALVAENPDAYFARVPVIRLESEIEESSRDVEETALQIRATATTEHAPRNPGNCFAYGRTCEFHDVCSGIASLDDPTLFRRAETPHEELSLNQKP
jgi:hypothetical protein